ncbi:MAG: site-specific integrase [Pseudonocardia sp.]
MFAMTTGARRGEVCGLRWSQLNLDTGLAVFRASIGQIAGERWEKDTKTHQQRRVTLDAELVEVLRAHRTRCNERAALVDAKVRRDGFVFSTAPDCSTMTHPNSVTQRYGRLARRVGIDTHFHCLRHSTATELIAAGVDIRTVAGRLGHSGGGSTTLRTYTALVLEADQRAATELATRRPRPSATPPWSSRDRDLMMSRIGHPYGNRHRTGLTGHRHRACPMSCDVPAGGSSVGTGWSALAT